MPGQRHDGSAWKPADSQRQKAAGQTIPTAVLAELRADWGFLKSCFRLPQYNGTAGMRWRCNCTPSTRRDCTAQAPWRKTTLNHWQFMQRLNKLGLTVSPLFSCPSFRMSAVAIDWLHTVDKGTAADYLGNVSWMLQKKCLVQLCSRVLASSSWTLWSTTRRHSQTPSSRTSL